MTDAGRIAITPNALESDRFAVRFARLELADGVVADLDAALARADGEGIDVISARVDTLDLPTVRALEDAGFRLMDTLVYHRLTLSPGSASDGADADDGYAVVPLTSADADTVAVIARHAFAGYLGHYHADPRLADDAATEAYADWIHRALSAPAAEQIVLGCRVDGRLAGFLLGLCRTPGSSEITLNAVDPQAQRGGVYRALLRRYIARAQARGDHEVLISTQLPNYAVQRVWNREGFVLSHAWHTLHRWTPAV